jgi:hypothetical protein
LTTQNTDFYQQGIEKFLPPNYKYFSFGGSYVEMWWDSSAVIKSELLTVKGSATAA